MQTSSDLDANHNAITGSRKMFAENFFAFPQTAASLIVVVDAKTFPKPFFSVQLNDAKTFRFVPNPRWYGRRSNCDIFDQATGAHPQYPREVRVYECKYVLLSRQFDQRTWRLCACLACIQTLCAFRLLQLFGRINIERIRSQFGR